MPPSRNPDPMILLVALLCPGCGHFLRGEISRGLYWMGLMVVGPFLVLPDLLLRGLCAWDAVTRPGA